MKHSFNIIAQLSFILAVSCSHSAFANSEQITKSSHSLGEVKSNTSQKQRLNNFKQLIISGELFSNAHTETRKQRLAKKKEQMQASIALQKSNIQPASYDHSFLIYDAYSQLIEDYDRDGYYQTFSVTFDADVLTTSNDTHARVYAEMYVSQNGGDWMHYYTTDDFSIYGENTTDEYEVYTTLNQGFIPDEYDVLIDLYEVGYSDIIASYSSNDDNDLYGLPLESSDYDPDYVDYDSDSHGHGGSSSLWVLLLLVIAIVYKKQAIAIRG